MYDVWLSERFSFFYIFSSSAFFFCRTCMQLEKSSGGLMRPNSSWSWETVVWLTFAWVRTAPREIITTVRHPGIPTVTSSPSGISGTLSAQDREWWGSAAQLYTRTINLPLILHCLIPMPPPIIRTMNICCKFNCKKWKTFLLSNQCKISQWPWGT